MNSFEQLNHLGVAATHIFEDFATLLIRVEHPDSMRTRLSQGDGGVDAWVADPETDRQHVFQVKFHPGKLTEKRCAEIEESFKTALNSPRVDMSRWTLCLPGRLSTEDGTWFHNWKQAYPQIAIDLWDGDKLMELLASPKAASARKMLSKFDVSGVPSAGARLLPSVHVVFEETENPRFDAVLVVQIKNEGDKTARDLKAKVKFSPVACYPFGAPPPEKWSKIRNGMFESYSDFEIHALHSLHNDDKILVIEIPFKGISTEPFHLAIDIYAENTDAAHWFVEIPPSAFFKSGRHELQSRSASALGEVKGKPVMTLSQPAVRIAKEILEIEDPSNRGVTLIEGGHPSDPLMGAYMPWLSRGGKGVRFMKKSLLRSALLELQGNGFLDTPVSSASTKTTVYEFHPEKETSLRTVVKELAIPEETTS